MAGVLRALRRTPGGARLGLFIIVANLFAMVFGPWLAPFGETQVVEGADVWEPSFWDEEFWPSLNRDRDPKIWLGTDHLGRDLLTRLLFGARNTIAVALLTTLLSFGVGISIGFVAAATRGWVDKILGRVVDLTMALPTMILALAILSVVGASVANLIVVIAVFGVPPAYRLSRALARDFEVTEFVEAATLRGEGWWWPMRREVLRKALPFLAAEFGTRFCFVFLSIAALSFLGLGIQPPTADWASMVRENAGAISFGVFTPLVPAGAIAVLTIGVNLVADWLGHQSPGTRPSDPPRQL